MPRTWLARLAAAARLFLPRFGFMRRVNAALWCDCGPEKCVLASTAKGRVKYVCGSPGRTQYLRPLWSSRSSKSPRSSSRSVSSPAAAPNRTFLAPAAGVGSGVGSGARSWVAVASRLAVSSGPTRYSMSAVRVPASTHLSCFPAPLSRFFSDDRNLLFFFALLYTSGTLSLGAPGCPW